MIIQGNLHADHRGTIRFVNDFTFDGIKRFYTITHPDTHTIRAWQGHKQETKYFMSPKAASLSTGYKSTTGSSPQKTST